ncbi:hypothetical protein SUDANB1_08207 [Streptomyces sp. enrichment culture]
MVSKPVNKTRLMELFGLSNLSATRYILSAHPDRKTGPIAP